MSEPTGPQRVPESVVARLRPHSRALFWPIVLLIVVAGATGYLFGRFPQEWANWAVLGGGALLALVGFVMPLLSWLSRSYTITTRRVVIRSGVAARTRQELLHSRGYDVTVRKAGLQLLFRSGDVLINTGLDRPVMLRDVPGVDLVQAALHDLMDSSSNPVATRRQEERSRRGTADFGDGWGGR